MHVRALVTRLHCRTAAMPCTGRLWVLCRAVSWKHGCSRTAARCCQPSTLPPCWTCFCSTRLVRACCALTTWPATAAIALRVLSSFHRPPTRTCNAHCNTRCPAGTSGRFVQYGSLVADLQELVMSAAPLAHPVLQLALHLRTLLALIHTDCPAASLHCSASTIPSLSCRPIPHAQAQAPSCPEEAEALAAAAYANAAAPVAPLPLSRPETAPVPAAQQPRRPPPLAWVQQQQQLQEEEQLLPAAQQQLLDQQQLQPLLSPVMHQAPPKQQPAAFARRPVVPAAPQPSLRSRPSSAMVSESGGIMPLNHYLQNMISPRSRSEYDAFNRFHFSRQQQAGRDPRAVTPKVCMQACLSWRPLLPALTRSTAWWSHLY